MPGSESNEPPSAESAENIETAENAELAENAADNEDTEIDGGAEVGDPVSEPEPEPEAEAEAEIESQKPDSGEESATDVADAAPEREQDRHDEQEQHDQQERQVWATPGGVGAGEPRPGQTPPGPDAGGAQEELLPDGALYLGTYADGSYGAAAVEPVDPTVKKRKRKRVLWTVAAVVAAAALVTGGVIALLPGRTGNSVVAAVKCTPGKLASCLIKAPDGALRLTASSTKDTWPQQTAATTDLFASNIIDDAPGVSADVPDELTNDGRIAIVHNDWNAVDGDDVDIVLLSFSTQQGAQDWNSTREGEILSAYLGQTVSVPGDSTGAAHVAAKRDAKGNTDAAYSAVVGDVVLNVAYSSPNTFDAQDLKSWAGTEIASLRTAPAPPADPAPAAPGTQQVGCTDRLNSCLMEEPAGGERWTDPTDDRWSGDSTLTSSQVAHLWWDGDSASDQDSVLAGFNADGVTGIGHEAWTVDDANEQADIYLLRTITAAGAEQLATAYLGEPGWADGAKGDAFTIPGESSAQGWYSSKRDAQGFTDVYVTETFGNVNVAAWFYFYGSFNRSVTDSWAKSQLSKVSATVKTEPMGVFSLKAPALPAPVQGSCGTSVGCLIALPAGATDTTTKSYEQSTSVNVQDYAVQYEEATVNDFASWLGSDGFQGGAHRSWTASNGATADAVVLKYSKSSQAKAAALLEYGMNAGVDRVCTDSALPDSVWCLAPPVNVGDALLKQQVWVVAWKGDYEVSVAVTVSNSADVSQAYAWAEQQLDKLPAS